MTSGGFTTSAGALPTLAAVLDDRAAAIRAAIAPFQQGAIDGMADAWGEKGADQRTAYLEQARQVPAHVSAIADGITAMAEKLRQSDQATKNRESATADLFGSILAANPEL